VSAGSVGAAWGVPLRVRYRHRGQHHQQAGRTPLLQLLAILALQAGRRTPSLIALGDRLGRRVRQHVDPFDADTRRDIRAAWTVLATAALLWILLKVLLTELPRIG